MNRPLSGVIFLPWILIGLVALSAGLSLLWPFPELEQARSGPWSLQVADRNGDLLQVLPVNESGLRREYRRLDAMPQYLVRIFLTSEDSRFFLHPGVDPAAVLRAAAGNSSAGRIVSGASTVTMQLARRVSPGGAGFAAKLLEAWNALRIEVRLSKAEILELWLNTLPMGANVEGVAAAAREYFSRDLQTLSPEECALLALIPRNPRRYDPRSGSRPDLADELLERAGIGSSPDAMSQALREAAESGAADPWPFRAPHFVRYAASLYSGDGLQPLVTSLDPELQRLLQDEIGGRVQAAAENRIGNGAGIVLSVETGEILAYAGSADFFDAEHQGQIDGVRILRQPGSTIKPFLYSLALERGMTPATLLPDVPLAFGGDAVYIPENFSNTYHGPVRLRVALASSLNIPAVYTVVQTGVSDFAERLLALGFDSLAAQKETVGAGIALGNAEVSLMELVSAFSVFQRDGLYLPPSAAPGFSGEPPGRVMDPETAFLVRDILSSDSGRVTGFGTASILNTPFPAMFKTGTSNQFNNIWALGATEKLAAGVWMGNFSGETVIGRPGSSIPAASVVALLSAAQELPSYRAPREPAPPPPGITVRRICTLTGDLAGPYCPGTADEYFRAGTEPEFCTAHRPDGTFMPLQYRDWAEGKGLPWRFDDPVVLRIVTPADNAVFYLDPTLPAESQSLRIEAEGEGKLTLFVDGTAAASGTGTLSLRIPLQQGTHRIVLQSEGEKRESSYSVR